MAYLDTRQRPSVASMVAVVAIHGAVGAALVLGLTVSGLIPAPDVPMPTFNVKPTLPPPPPVPEPTSAEAIKREVVVPRPPIALPTQAPTIDISDIIPPPQPPVQPGTGEIARPSPTPAPSFAALAARPRNDPLKWVTTADYRSNWIRQDMTGRARFRLDIAADGRVTGCTITGSSGHAELDAATCALVTRRARFQPGRDSTGAPAASSYSSAIEWRLPD